MRLLYVSWKRNTHTLMMIHLDNPPVKRPGLRLWDDDTRSIAYELRHHNLRVLKSHTARKSSDSEYKKSERNGVISLPMSTGCIKRVGLAPANEERIQLKICHPPLARHFHACWSSLFCRPPLLFSPRSQPPLPAFSGQCAWEFLAKAHENVIRGQCAWELYDL